MGLTESKNSSTRANDKSSFQSGSGQPSAKSSTFKEAVKNFEWERRVSTVEWRTMNREITVTESRADGKRAASARTRMVRFAPGTVSRIGRNVEVTPVRVAEGHVLLSEPIYGWASLQGQDGFPNFGCYPFRKNENKDAEWKGQEQEVTNTQTSEAVDKEKEDAEEAKEEYEKMEHLADSGKAEQSTKLPCLDISRGGMTNLLLKLPKDLQAQCLLPFFDTQMKACMLKTSTVHNRYGPSHEEKVSYQEEKFAVLVDRLKEVSTFPLTHEETFPLDREGILGELPDNISSAIVELQRIDEIISHMVTMVSRRGDDKLQRKWWLSVWLLVSMTSVDCPGSHLSMFRLRYENEEGEAVAELDNVCQSVQRRCSSLKTILFTVRPPQV